MNLKEENRIIAKDHLIRAEKSLRAARILLEQELYEDSISRSYYSIYHAMYAMLYLIGKTARTHKGLMHLFYTNFIVDGKISNEVNRKVNKVLNARSDADYGSIPFINDEDAIEAVTTSTEMYNIAVNWIENI